MPSLPDNNHVTAVGGLDVFIVVLRAPFNPGKTFGWCPAEVLSILPVNLPENKAVHVRLLDERSRLAVAGLHPVNKEAPRRHCVPGYLSGLGVYFNVAYFDGSCPVYQAVDTGLGHDLLLD